MMMSTVFSCNLLYCSLSFAIVFVISSILSNIISDVSLLLLLANTSISVPAWGRCGSFMRPKSGRKTANGEKRYYYQCECKEKSKGNLCQMPNIPGNVLDKMTAAGIFSLKEKVVKDYSYLYKTIETTAWLAVNFIISSKPMAAIKHILF